MSEPGVLPQELFVGTLERVSPSRFLSLKRCALQAIWSRLHEPLLPKWPAARLGTVAHQLIEEVGYGKHGAGREDLEQAWETLVEAQEREMKDSWLERNLVPLSESARDYHVRKYRALDRAFEAAQFFEEADITDSSGSGGRERWVQSKDGKAGGKIDLVAETDRGIVLRDYKTGQVFENGSVDDPAGEQVKEDYQIQLKLYAALSHEQHGQWPVALEVVPVGGSPHRIPFTPDDCEDLLREAVKLLEETNQQVSEAQAEGMSHAALLRRLASPTPEACKFCAFRPACPAYWKEREHTGRSNWPSDVAGKVTSLRELGNGQLHIQVQQKWEQEVDCRGLNPEPERHPALKEAEVGKGIAICNLRRSGDATYSEAATTTIYVR